MEYIAGYQVCSSNASKKQLGTVTVKREGHVLARVQSTRSGLLQYIRKNPASKERLQLVQKLIVAGVSEQDISQMLCGEGEYNIASVCINLSKDEIVNLEERYKKGFSSGLESRMYQEFIHAFK